MVRFLRRHSLDKSNSHTHLRKEEQESNSCTESDTAEMQEPGGNGGGDLDVMKERFAKLLLGEDMSGTGKGVPSALALSNAITNLAASVFGEHRKLEPMAPDTKERWKKEVGWLLSVTDHIVEFVPTRQTAENGTTMEIMSTAQRRDLQMNIPALRKLDAMLIGYMDNFVDQTEFWYEKGGDNKRDDDKWWMPTVKVPAEGLSDVTRKWLQYQKECVNQVLKAAMAINAQVLVEMEIPEIYIESLPKKGKTSLGDAIYRSITDEEFDPIEFLEGVDLSTEHKVLDLKNRIEASTIIWKRKMQTKDAKSSWGSIISFEKREQFEERAETILHLLKLQFPGAPQSQLDISKIQYNRDVGYALLESYSRVLESLAYSVISRIEDVLGADAAATNLTASEAARRQLEMNAPRKLDAREELEKLNEAPASMTLYDFMGWHFDQDELMRKKEEGTLDEAGGGMLLKKAPSLAPKKFSYVDSLAGGVLLIYSPGEETLNSLVREHRRCHGSIINRPSFVAPSEDKREDKRYKLRSVSAIDLVIKPEQTSLVIPELPSGRGCTITTTSKSRGTRVTATKQLGSFPEAKEKDPKSARRKKEPNKSWTRSPRRPRTPGPLRPYAHMLHRELAPAHPMRTGDHDLLGEDPLVDSRPSLGEDYHQDLFPHRIGMN
uniref:Rop guanine nucleotide exchange factor 1 n=1 Tax=Aegilops tauschii TaxID=37682 RepID=M8C1B7_AEGTA